MINLLFGTPLGYVMRFCYAITQSYGLAIVLFAVLARIILLPVSVMAQKNSVKMARLKPRIDAIKSRYAENKDRIADEQMALFKKEKYNPVFGIIPLLAQIPLILGLLNVMYNPLRHLIRLLPYDIGNLAHVAENQMGAPLERWGGELQIIDAVQQNPRAFQGIVNEDILSRINSLDLSFLGLDLSLVPAFTHPTIIIAGLSGLSALFMCIIQGKTDVLQKVQPLRSKITMTIITVVFSSYFAFVVPAGVGLYWIAGNLATTVVIIILNRIYNVVDMGRHTQKAALTKAEKLLNVEQSKKNREREKADIKRFINNDKKQLMFYSQASGFYKYFKEIIQYITANSDISIHYVTSDPNDKIFETENKKIIPYYVGDRALISFMLELDIDMVVMTMPDLNLFHIKRSYVRKDIEYIFLDHGMTSYHLQYREGALNHYDTIFAYGPNHIEEIRQTESVYGLSPKKIVATGYALLDELLEHIKKYSPPPSFQQKQILIAPSWQEDNLMELCLDEIISQLVGKDFCVIIRPHPEFIKRFPDKMNAIYEKHKSLLDENFIIQTDFSSNETVFQSDLVITDWSSIAQEFSYATKKPSLFINTPIKIMNPNYTKIPCVPLDISLRNDLGGSVEVDELSNLHSTVNNLLERRDFYKEKITKVLNKNIFNIGNSKQIAGDYIIHTLLASTAAKIFKCHTNEITEIESLKKGMTNRSYIFKHKEKKYIIRLPGEGTNELIDRYKEAAAYKEALKLDIADDVIYMNPDTGHKITTFWENTRVCNPKNFDEVALCMKMLKNFHEMKLQVPHEFDVFERINYYQSLWDKPSMYSDYQSTKSNVFSLREYIDALKIHKCLTHFDAVPDNFIFLGDKASSPIRLIDWEYASMGDPHMDIAMFAIYAMYERAEVEKLIDSYFTEACTKEIRAKIYAYIAMCGLLWSNWCEYKRQLGVEFGEYALKQYQFAKDYYQIFTEAR